MIWECGGEWALLHRVGRVVGVVAVVYYAVEGYMAQLAHKGRRLSQPSEEIDKSRPLIDLAT